MTARNSIIVILLSILTAAPVAAQPASPPAPKEYQAYVRYRIRAAQTERVRQFQEMLTYLESIGFRKEPGPDDEAEDPNQVLLAGIIPSANASKILLERHVRSVLLMPVGLQAPADPETPVKVRIFLSSGLDPDRQSLLASQVQSVLRGVGFRPAVGYDDRGHTQLVGTLPARNVVRLLEDLRLGQSGLLLPEQRLEDLPSPLSRIWPVRLIEVTPEPAGLPPAREQTFAPPLGAANDTLLKITPELQALVAQKDQANGPTRMQVILSRTPEPLDRTWQSGLHPGGPGNRPRGPAGSNRGRTRRAGPGARAGGASAGVHDPAAASRPAPAAAAGEVGHGRPRPPPRQRPGADAQPRLPGARRGPGHCR